MSNPENYYIASVCMNGHVISEAIEEWHEENEHFCEGCGEPTIIACENCDADLRGTTTDTWERPNHSYSPPAHCYSCGAAFPWTERRLDTVKQIAAQAEEFSDADRDGFAATLDDLTRDTPKTKLATQRMRTLLDKAKDSTRRVIENALAQVVTASVKTWLGL